MKKIILNLLFVCLSISGFSQSYQSALKKLNDYLKTFDNGYYGYLEIKDGYLYDRFKNGNDYCRGKMAEMDYAFEKEKNRKVDLVCKGTNLCVYSTFTNGNYNSFTFSQSTDFNTSELITLLNNFVKAYHKNSTSKNTEDEEYGRLQDDLDKYKSNIDIMNSGSNQKTNSSSNTSTTKTVSSQDYKDKAQKALQELNDYMVTLDNGRYKGMEVTNGYIIQNYEGGQSSKAKIEDIDRVEINTEYNYAKLACKGDSKCVYSSITGGYHDYFNFNVGSKSLSKMETLLKNFLTALKKCTENTISSTATNSTGVKTEAQKLREQKERERQSKTNNSNDEDDFFWMDGASDATAKVAPKTNATSSIKYETPLKNLNDYLKTFNPETYKDVEVKNGKVYFKFYVYGTVYNSYIDISALVNNTIVLKGKSVGAFGSEEIKIACKGESKCFYSEYSKGTADHFRFFSRSVADLSKMKQLVDDFIKSLPAK